MTRQQREQSHNTVWKNSSVNVFHAKDKCCHLQNDHQVSLLRCLGRAKNRAGRELLVLVLFSGMYYECNVHIPVRRELAELVQRHILEGEHTQEKKTRDSSLHYQPRRCHEGCSTFKPSVLSPSAVYRCRT